MRNKIFKLLNLTLPIISIPVISGCSCNKQSSTEEKTWLEKIIITSDFGKINLEVTETYDSDTIKVKCLNNKQKEMSVDVQFQLIPLTDNQLDISIINNKLHVGANKEKGEYKYQLKAYDQSGIVSEAKEIDINVYENLPIPDQIELRGVDQTDFFTTSERTIDFNLIGKKDGVELEEFQDRCNLEYSIESSSTGLTKDIYNNDLFNLRQDDKTIKLGVSTHITGKYEGIYKVNIKACLSKQPSIYFIKSLIINMYNGLEYCEDGYTYGRDNTEMGWLLLKAPSDISLLTVNNTKDVIHGINVVGVGENFCKNSGITLLTVFKPHATYKYIGKNAFSGQTCLRNLFLENVEYIDESAFENCTKAYLNKTTVLNARSIAKHAFSGCSAFNLDSLPNIEYLSEKAFENSVLKSIQLGPNLTYIGVDCFNSSTSLTDIYINTFEPPTLLGDFMGTSCSPSYKIHVLTSAYEKYKNDPLWSFYSSKLVGDINS